MQQAFEARRSQHLGRDAGASAAAAVQDDFGAGVGSNTASWTPTIGITVPVGAVADDYTGTVTHSLL